MRDKAPNPRVRAKLRAGRLPHATRLFKITALLWPGGIVRSIASRGLQVSLKIDRKRGRITRFVGRALAPTEKFIPWARARTCTMGVLNQSIVMEVPASVDFL